MIINVNVVPDILVEIVLLLLTTVYQILVSMMGTVQTKLATIHVSVQLVTKEKIVRKISMNVNLILVMEKHTIAPILSMITFVIVLMATGNHFCI